MVHVESGEPGGSWSLEPIGTASDGIRFAALMAASDSLHAVWGRVADTEQEPEGVMYAVQTPGRGWSAPVDLLADLPLEMRWPSSAHLAAASTGGLVLVWSSRQLGFLVAGVAEGRLVGEPELVAVPDATGGCAVVSRPAYDASDRLVGRSPSTMCEEVPRRVDRAT